MITDSRIHNHPNYSSNIYFIIILTVDIVTVILIIRFV